jgi:hypothetical protein
MLRIRSFGSLVLFGIGLIGCAGDSSNLSSFDAVDGSDQKETGGDASDDGGDSTSSDVGTGGFVGDVGGSVDIDGFGDVEDGVDNDGSDAGDDGSSDGSGDDGSGGDGDATDHDGPGGIVNDASDGSTNSLADAPSEGGGDDVTLADASDASDTSDGDSTSDSTSDANADALDDAAEVASDATSEQEGAPDNHDAGAHPDAAPPPPPGPLSVAITWASIANVYIELGSTSVLINGYITRLPGNDFFGGGSGLALTHTNYSSDQAAISAVLTALGGPTRINWLFTGHSHWDHSFDTATWARLTGAPIYGPRTTCFEARAEGTAAASCLALYGGERLHLAPGVTVRVVRWNHSGNSSANPEQHNPVELAAVPTPDVQGRLRAGVAEDFPNGGGSRGFLFTFDSAAGVYSLFFEDSSSADDLTLPIIVDGVDYGAPLSNLKGALADASLTHVDLWIATGGSSVAQLVVPVLHPKVYLPIHWDGLFRAFHAGAPVFSDNALSTYLATQGVRLVTPLQYMDKWSLSPSGVVPMDNKQVQNALGL